LLFVRHTIRLVFVFKLNLTAFYLFTEIIVICDDIIATQKYADKACNLGRAHK